MRCVYAESQDPADPLAGLVVGDLEVSAPFPDWVPVRVSATCLNHHDLWSLRGVGLLPDRLPMILGTDAAGTDPDGHAVIVHSVISSPDWRGDETLDPARSLLSEVYPGTLAETVWVPRGNLIPQPDFLTAVEAAALPTAYLTAYRLLFTAADLRPGQNVLVQGAGGGVATAAILLARAAGLRVWVTSRDEGRGQRAVDLGAHEAFAAGARLPARVDAVLETVGEATWDHSLKSVKPGGTIAVAGSTSGANPPADLSRVFFRSVRIQGTTMGTTGEFARLLGLLEATGTRPLIDSTHPLDRAHDAFARLAGGEAFGKVGIAVHTP
ncbi:zinc-binding dehydrogenase [Pseudactinotalea sp. HY160]|uniref:zinc-binding dehydrogenase n=1 Tax=Pseudactinotalea sp. HY160 TaxID=2654490 RepID=UPI00128E8B84|nr:zinc-binding dehydrogenase [Pseudactinotalea sp. HY160]MPV49030.1 zinc-binding dehydrogenase [Pseudactinotalea sp. HY160]